MADSQPLWSPTQASIDASNMMRFIERVNENHGLAIDDYDALYRWSIDSKADF